MLQSIRVSNFPHTLILHLRRFSFNEETSNVETNTTFVEIPQHLRMGKLGYVRDLTRSMQTPPSPDPLYQLKAFIAHIGGSFDSGSFVAIVSSHGQWFLIDNATVTVCFPSFLSLYFSQSLKESDLPGYFGYPSTVPSHFQTAPPPPTLSGMQLHKMWGRGSAYILCYEQVL